MNEPILHERDAYAWHEQAHSPELLSDEEQWQVLQAAVASGMPQAPDDIAMILAWAAKLRLGERILSLVLKGKMAVRVHEGTIYLREPKKGDYAE